MPTRSNRYYNDPAIAQIASNLSGIFEPPSGGDAYGYAKAQGERAQQQRLSDLWNQAGNDFDRRGVAAGQYNPSQSYYAVDQGNAVDRRGQDIAANTSMSNNLRDNQYGLAGSIATTKVNPGQMAPGASALDPGLAEAIGLVPGQSIQGQDIPLSQDQVLAQAIMGMPQERQQDIAFSDVTPREIIGPDGTPMYTSELGAMGQTPVPPVSASSQDLVTYRTPQGEVGSALFNSATGQLIEASTGEPLPQGTVTGKVQDTSTGALTEGATSTVQKYLFDIDLAEGTARRLRDVIEANPATGGLVGYLSGSVQDLLQTGNEVATLFQSMQSNAQLDIKSGVMDEATAQLLQEFAFNPAIPAREALTVLLAFQIAKTQSPGRVSNEAVNRIAKSLGERDWLGNQRSSLAALDEMVLGLGRSREAALSQVNNGPGSAQYAPAPLPGQDSTYGASPAAPEPGTVEEGYRFLGGDPKDPNSWEAVQ